MKKHKTKIIIAALAVVVLVGAWFLSGTTSPAAPVIAAPVASADVDVTPTETPELMDDPVVSAEPAEEPLETEVPTETPEDMPEETAEPTKTPTPTMEINPDTGKDQYLTDPVPEGKPAPVEPQNVVSGDAIFTCTLSIRCDTILNNMNLLDVEKHELVPEDGVILATIVVSFTEGDSVFDVLRRETKRAGIHMEYMNTPIYNSAYIEGINNLYEFDVGELSGWMYKVNGWFPNYGCSRYALKDGDVIEWVYTCDLGRDVGGASAIGG